MIKIGQLEEDISTFLGSRQKMASLLPGTSSGQKKRRFLPGTSLFLPTSDVGGDIKHVYMCVCLTTLPFCQEEWWGGKNLLFSLLMAFPTSLECVCVCVYVCV